MLLPRRQHGDEDKMLRKTSFPGDRGCGRGFSDGDKHINVSEPPY